MDTSRIEEVKTPQHDGTPGSHGLLLGPVVVVLENTNNGFGGFTDAFSSQTN